MQKYFSFLKYYFAISNRFIAGYLIVQNLFTQYIKVKQEYNIFFDVY